MSLHTEVTVHCDGCGIWEHCSDSLGARDAATYLRSRQRRGWIIVKDGRTSGREDYCPDCAKKRAVAVGSTRDDH